jgi:hypothetical protein
MGRPRRIMNEQIVSIPETESKKPWQAPTIEEVDYGATEAAYVPGTPIDLGIYTV